MAQVVQEVTQQQVNNNSPVSFFMWLGHNWGYIVFALIVLILAIVVFYMLKKWEEERQERDDPVYQGYKNLIRDCELQCDKHRIRKTWSLINLLWFGLPIVKQEHSSKAVNYTNDNLGYYRGHSYSMDGYLNLLLYKEKFLIFFESLFLVRCPLQLYASVYMRDPVTNKILVDSDGKKRITKKKVKFDKYIMFLNNGDMKINCTTLQKYSYFRYPVYVKENAEIVDYRQLLQDDIVVLGQDQMISRVLSTGAEMVEKAMMHNPHVQYNQKSPEKTVEEKKDI